MSRSPLRAISRRGSASDSWNWALSFDPACGWVGTHEPDSSLKTDGTDGLTDWGEGLHGQRRDKGDAEWGGRGGVVSYLDGRPLEISARTWRSDAAKLLFTLTALVSDANKKEATLTTSCVCPIEGDVGGPEAAAGPVCPPEWFTSRTFVSLFRRPCLFLSSLLDTRHLLSLEWVVWQRRRRPRRS